MNVASLSEDVREFIEAVMPHLPPVIARSEVDRFLGGIISPYTIKNADLAGNGPEIAWKVGKKVAYKTESLLLWIAERSDGINRMKNLKTI